MCEAQMVPLSWDGEEIIYVEQYSQAIFIHIGERRSKALCEAQMVPPLSRNAE